jgi:hypothetical protein
MTLGQITLHQVPQSAENSFAMKESSLCGLAALIVITLSGCASTVPVYYAPSSVLSASGSVSVVPFTYAPALSGKVKENQIRNTAMGRVLLEQNVDVMFRDAVFKELRFVGVRVDNPNRQLSGEIQEFLIADLGFSIDWTLTVKYRVVASNATTYEGTKEIKRRTAKAPSFLGALNGTIKLNIEELIKDPAFIAAIK